MTTAALTDPTCRAIDTLHVRVVVTLCFPARRSTVTVEDADRRALQQHTQEVFADAVAVARRAMLARRGGGSSTRATRDGRGGRHGWRGRVVCINFHWLVEEATLMRVSCSCDVHHPCALSFVEVQSPEAGPTEHAHSHTRLLARIRPYMRCTKRWTYTPFFNRSVVSADRRTRQRRESHMPESP